MVLAAAVDQVRMTLFSMEPRVVAVQLQIAMATTGQPTQAAVAAGQIFILLVRLQMVAQVVQVTHELLIGVNHGTTLRIS